MSEPKDRTFKVPRNEGETWLGAVLRHAEGHGFAALEVMARFAAHLKDTGNDEEEAAIYTLLELDITPLAREGISGT